MKGATILFRELSPDYDWEDRFNEWYDNHYIPIRMKAPGFLSAQRYKDTDRPNYLTVYELESQSALETKEYLNIQEHPNAETKWVLSNVAAATRYIGNEISSQWRDDAGADGLDASFIYSVFFSVPDEAADAFNAWYTEEHVPMLLKCSDWLGCRRFLISEGDPQPWTHLALHYIADMSAFDSPEREAARSTELRQKLSEEPWFNASTLVYERWGDRFMAER